MIVEALLAVIDRIIQLKSYRDDRKRRLFDSVFAPVFHDLLLVHGDYVAMFMEILQMLPPEEAESSAYLDALRRAAHELRLRRLQFEPVRQKLRATVDEIETLSLPENARSFMQAVTVYFPDARLSRIPTAASMLLAQINYWREAKEIPFDIAAYRVDGVSPSRLLQSMIWDLIHQYHWQWSDVCAAYAKLELDAAGHSSDARADD